MEGGEAAAVCEGGKVYPGVTAVTRGCKVGGGTLWPPTHDKVGLASFISERLQRQNATDCRMCAQICAGFFCPHMRRV